MPRLNQLLNRAALTQEEIHILRGIAKMMDRSGKPPNALPATGAGTTD
jgi:tRNA/rRNA methyltransferase